MEIREILKKNILRVRDAELIFLSYKELEQLNNITIGSEQEILKSYIKKSEVLEMIEKRIEKATDILDGKDPKNGVTRLDNYWLDGLRDDIKYGIDLSERIK